MVSAQRTEFGIWGGGSGYMGDINPSQPLKITDPAGALFLRINYNAFWALRLGVAQGKVRASDAESSDPNQRLRNLSFQSTISEVSGMLEFNLFKYAVKTRYKFSPYVFTGLSAFLFNPQAEYQGSTYDLQPFGTEGQQKTGKNDTYDLVSLAIPFGVGFKYNIGGKTTLAADIGYRKAFTDYLDDVSGNYAGAQTVQNNNGTIAAAFSDRSGEVNNGENLGRSGSQRGDGTKKDMFLLAGISITYTFVPQKCPTFD